MRECSFTSTRRLAEDLPDMEKSGDAPVSQIMPGSNPLMSYLSMLFDALMDCRVADGGS